MASQYLQQLDAITSTLGTYLIPISDDPSGVGRLKKITFTNLLGGTLGSAAYTASSAYDAAGAAAAVVSDIAYDATSWNGVTGIAPSKNAVRDYLNTLGTAAFVNIDTDTTLAANSDSIVATQKATKAYVDAMVTGLLEFKGSVDCSANPNYSSANKGDSYYVSVAGKIGGASGETVEVGDVIVASADNAGGTEASVGTSWFVMEHNLVGAAVTSGTLAQFAATTSAQLAGVISDETGSGSLVFATSPTLVTPVLGVASATSLTVTGTSGAGYLALIGQASTPANPAAGTMLIYSETEQGVTRLLQHNEEITNLILGQDNAFVVRNTSGASIAKGSVVYVTGSTGHTPNVSKAQANSSVTTPAVGVLVDAIADNAYGQAMFTGVLSGIDTSTLVSGDPVFLSATVAGGLTTTRPSGTTNIVQAIGTVLVVGVGNGEIKIAIAPALLNTETGTNAATWTGSAVVATSLVCPTFTSADALGFTPSAGSGFNVTLSGVGDLAVNTSQLYVDTSTGNVGIGTATPGALLDCNKQTVGELAIRAKNTTVDATSYAAVIAAADTAISYLYTYNSSHGSRANIGNVGTITAHDFCIRTADTARIYIQNSTGNVGIGTITPSARLHAISTTEQLRLGYDASNYYSTTVSSAGAVTFDAVGASSSFTFSDAITLSVATPLISFQPTVNTQDCGLKILNAAGSAAGYLSIVPNTIGTNSKFFMYIGGAAAADIKLTVDDDGVTNIKRDASNYCTITPSSVGLITFDAVGSGAAFSFADNVSVTNTAGDCIVTATGGTPSTTAGDGYLLLASSRTDTGVGHVCKLRSVAPSAGKADLAFLTQPSNGVYTERMRIDNAGNVGIGMTPTYFLDALSPTLTNFGTKWVVRARGPSTCTTNGTNYLLAFDMDVSDMSVTAGVTDSGYRMGVRGNAITSTTGFAGTLATQYGVLGRAGISSATSGAVVTNAYAMYTEVLNSVAGTTITNGFGLYVANTETTGTITNRYGVYVNTATGGKNYFSHAIGIGISSPTASIHTTASTTSAASACLPHGTAPTTPVNGDMWTTTAGLFVRINGVTKTVTLT